MARCAQEGLKPAQDRPAKTTAGRAGELLGNPVQPIHQGEERTAPHDNPADEVERAALEAVSLLVHSIAKQLSRQWDADREELRHQAMVEALSAIRAFDGRGDLAGFVGQRVRHRLVDHLKCQQRRRRVGRPLYNLRQRHQSRQTCRDVVVATPEPSSSSRSYRDEGEQVGMAILNARRRQRREGEDEASVSHALAGTRRRQGEDGASLSRALAVLDDPSRRLQVAEAAARVRQHLSSQEIDVLRLRCDRTTTKAIAAELRITPRRVQQLLRDSWTRIQGQAVKTGLPKEEILLAVLERDEATWAKARKLLGCTPEDLSRR